MRSPLAGKHAAIIFTRWMSGLLIKRLILNRFQIFPYPRRLREKVICLLYVIRYRSDKAVSADGTAVSAEDMADIADWADIVQLPRRIYHQRIHSFLPPVPLPVFSFLLKHPHLPHRSRSLFMTESGNTPRMDIWPRWHQKAGFVVPVPREGCFAARHVEILVPVPREGCFVARRPVFLKPADVLKK